MVKMYLSCFCTMPPASNDLFYSRLPANEIPLADLLMEEHLFYHVPENWHVVITDVKKSTVAVNNGLHETVNLVATGSIVAVLNIAYRQAVTVPFFFGGDGATFIIPPSILDSCFEALLVHRDNTLNSFNLDLRVGQVPVADLYQKQHRLRISKLRASGLFTIPVLLGDGLSYAEQLVKSDNRAEVMVTENKKELDLSGMNCRWDKIRPPAQYDEVVSLLVIAREKDQAAVFKKVIETLDQVYGAPEKRKPISTSALRLNGSLKKLALEMRTRFGGYRPLYLFRIWAASLLGSIYFRTRPGKTYLMKLVDLSDTLVIDGRISTVISGTTAQREQLVQALSRMEEEKEITFGIHVSKESVMSCYVRNLDDDHIHFIDGAEGGYTRAATMLKKKLAGIRL